MVEVPWRRTWPSLGVAWAGALDDSSLRMALLGWAIAFVCLIDFVPRDAWIVGLLVVVPLSLPLGYATVFAWFFSWHVITDDPMILRRGLWIALTPFLVLGPLAAAYGLGMAIHGVALPLALAFAVALPLLIAAYVTLHLIVSLVWLGPMIWLQIGLEKGRGVAILIYFLQMISVPVLALFLSDWLEGRFGAEIEAFWNSDAVLIKALRAASAFPSF